ncbi:hypothetical protein BXZ70DRAFT_1005141 [Cristinia sonorae]|uniref:Uncharacterized protein n=1 Tax=Cristinia sonorae TaxID=1940300 RepID=A0A8K0XT01_9AGAR|nr:hypothetical protein BXZ70DRAFT_1005141 [Cristinia sonorae]
MSLSFGSPFDIDDTTSPGWGASVPLEDEDVVTAAIKKEKVIKEIVAQQEDLKALLVRVKDVQKDVDKLISGNETLQMYIDNLTLQMAKRR